MASQNTQYVQGPKMDWTEEAGLHQWFKDWREETELLLDTVLSHIRNQETKLQVCQFMGWKRNKEIPQHGGWRQKRQSKDYAQTHSRTGPSPSLKKLAAFTQLRALNQGNKTLSTCIQEVRRIVDLCNFTCLGDCKYRLTRNSIVAGLFSTKAYQQCISKGSSLTLSKCIKICQTEDATCRQVQALCPESTDCTDSTSACTK